MTKVVDQQIDRLLDIAQVDVNDDTYVFLLSDNGTPDEPELVMDPVSPGQVKGTVYEGGVRVPLYVAGPDVVDDDSGGPVPGDRVVNITDIYATILDLADRSNPRPETWERHQSRSFVTSMTEAVPFVVRSCVYTEVFAPNGPGGTTTYDMYNRAIAGVTVSSAPDVMKSWRSSAAHRWRCSTSASIRGSSSISAIRAVAVLSETR